MLGNNRLVTAGLVLLASIATVTALAAPKLQQTNHKTTKRPQQQTSKPTPAQQVSKQASKPAVTSLQVAASTNSINCSITCPAAQYSGILQSIGKSENLVNRLKNLNAPTKLAGLTLDPACVRELVVLIKDLAANEMEMKTVLEFASDTGPAYRPTNLLPGTDQQLLHLDNGPLYSVLSLNESANQQEIIKAIANLDLKQVDWLEKSVGQAARECPNDGQPELFSSITLGSATASAQQPAALPDSSDSKVAALPKLLANVDQGISALEKFTTTREWTSVIKVFKSFETILNLFATPSIQKSSGKTLINVSIENLNRDLPGEVQTLTEALNNLLPWHVWPWNNVDLYSTIDTFINHGIFAFSKSTTGPQRRIDQLQQMLKFMADSLKLESFPKKCGDWSKTICDQQNYFDHLVAGPQGDKESANDRESRIKTLSSNNKNQLTQELTCIMFSSMSMQKFGASKELETTSVQHSAKKQLSWDRLVVKGLRLYALSREALTDAEWSAIYSFIKETWNQQRISDRLMMAGRVIQLLTNCHIPKEMLDSAMWKDIYKYKNAFNQLIGIVIEEINRSADSGKLNVQQVALGSKNLNEILGRLIKVAPRLTESLTQTLVSQLPELVEKFFNEKAAFFKTPCKGSSFSDIIGSLSKHKAEIVEIERLVCQQFNTKPNITMMQINNLTTDFFAVALNFTSFGVDIPKLLSSFEQTTNSPKGPPTQKPAKSDVASVIDELAANPRLSQIVAILQSSTLDPPEVQAALPELDWVEAATSAALMYESIQRLMSFEGEFQIFPEIDGFQAEMGKRADSSQAMLRKFSKSDPIRLIAYSMDAAMPIALRTFKPINSFHAECLASFRDIFSEDLEGRPTRQWPCLVSSINFGSWATNNFMITFNSMLKNVLAQMQTKAPSANNGTCIFFDGSLNVVLDNPAELMDLALETVLMASTSADQQLSTTNLLHSIICSKNNQLDPFDEKKATIKDQIKEKLCNLFEKSSLANCAQFLKADEWGATMRKLNSTWFESSALSVAPSFRDITQQAHESLALFGSLKPSTMSDSLVARLMNVNSFWANSLNKVVSILDKYQEKRFEFALQTLTPIFYDNLPADLTNKSNPVVREVILSTVFGANNLISLLEKQDAQAGKPASGKKSPFETQVQQLFDWTDQHSVATAEGWLRTIANNVTKLEKLFEAKRSGSGKSVKLTRPDAFEIWTRLCSAPTTDTYFELQPVSAGKAQVAASASLARQLDASRASICKFDWVAFYKSFQAAQTSDKAPLANYTERQLTRIALTKWGQVLDLLLVRQVNGKSPKPRAKFLQIEHWQPLFGEKLAQISPMKDQPSSLLWIWTGISRILVAMESGAVNNDNQATPTTTYLVKMLDQLNCGLDQIKGGLTWDNMANIYQDKQDILAAHSLMNNGFALASIGMNTFLEQQKFQRFLNELVRPRVGLTAFCDLRNRTQLESIFSIPRGEEYYSALESFQELICDASLEALAQNLNPISVCYQPIQPQTSEGKAVTVVSLVADSMDRFFKLSSLAALDAKLVASSTTKPPILDRQAWSKFWEFWSEKAGPQPNSVVGLALVRAFQTIDSINTNHVVWRALFRSVNEVSELVAYLLRAIEKKHQEVDSMAAAARLSLVREAATQLDSVIRSQGSSNSSQLQQQQLASALSNIMFPEVNNFISFRTFKQLRYLRSISEYFALSPDAKESVCQRVGSNSTSSGKPAAPSRRLRQSIDLIGYKLNTHERLYALLCHYNSSQWLTALNVVVSSTKSYSIPKKVNYMTKYLSVFTRSYKENEELENYLHGQQLETIEHVANATASYLLATSESLKSLSFTKLSNISWHSLPNLLDSIDRHLCASKHQLGSFQIPVYEPKRPDLETVLCKLPQWNVTQVYSYLSENFDLQNMISLITQQQQQQINQNATTTSSKQQSTVGTNQTATAAATTKTCVTPFKFASRWLKIGQEIVDEASSKATRDRIRKCLSSSRKGLTVYMKSMRYVKVVNSLLSSINDLTDSNSWHIVRRAWNSISYLILDQSYL